AAAQGRAGVLRARVPAHRSRLRPRARVAPRSPPGALRERGHPLSPPVTTPEARPRGDDVAGVDERPAAPLLRAHRRGHRRPRRLRRDLGSVPRRRRHRAQGDPMTTTRTAMNKHPLVEAYLADLDRALRGSDPRERAETLA